MNLLSLICLWFYLPILIFAPVAGVFAIAWRRPVRIAVLRPFQRKSTSRKLQRLVGSELSGYGHVYTLEDRYLRLAWLRRAPWLGLLPFVTFQHRYESEAHTPRLAAAMRSRFKRTINWFYARRKIFTITTTDRVWTSCLTALLEQTDVVVIDLTGFHDSVLWELDHVVETGQAHRTICIVEKPEIGRAGWLLNARHPRANLRLVAYTDGGTKGALSRLVAEIVSAPHGRDSWVSEAVPAEASGRTVREVASLTPADYVQLFVRPRRFFKGAAALASGRKHRFIAWLGGVAYSIDRMEGTFTKAEAGQFLFLAEKITLAACQTWFGFWLFHALVGIVAGWILWFLAGWWYRMRLEFSGAVAPDARLVRAVCGYQRLVCAIPAIVVAGAYTSLFESYAHSRPDQVGAIITGAFILWSCVVSYIGAITTFAVSRWWAALWFLVTPLAWYALVMAAVRFFWGG